MKSKYSYLALESLRLSTVLIDFCLSFNFDKKFQTLFVKLLRSELIGVQIMFLT